MEAMNTRSHWRAHGLALLLILGGATRVDAAELRLMVEPNYPPDRAAEVYKPLVEYLSKASGHDIQLLTPRNFHFFWRDIRQNVAVDLMFTEAHLTDYRAKRFATVPFVRTAERTSYSIVTCMPTGPTSLKDLVGASVVTMPSPSMGYALLTQYFPNPVSQPNILSSAVSWRDGVEMACAEETQAAIVPTWLRQQYPNLTVIETSASFPGPAISASATLDPAVRDSIKTALLKLHEDPTLYEVLNELGITKFEETSAAEYDGAEQVLKGVYGY